MAKIDGKTYFEVVENNHPYSKFPSHITVSVLRKRFCSPMTRLGLCNSQCKSNCGESLGKINKAMWDAKNIQHPAGLLTYICRTEASNRAEEAHEMSTYDSSDDDLSVDTGAVRNVFLELVRSLEEK